MSVEGETRGERRGGRNEGGETRGEKRGGRNEGGETRGIIEREMPLTNERKKDKRGLPAPAVTSRTAVTPSV